MTVFEGVVALLSLIISGVVSLLSGVDVGGFNLFQFCCVIMIAGIVISVFVRSGKA